MDSKLQINIGLFFVVLLLAAMLVFFGEEKQVSPRLSDIDQNTIDTITVLRKDQEDIQFIKRNNIWTMASPLRLKASSARIASILKVINTTSYADFNLADHNLSQFDLADPKISIMLNEYEFKFGSTDAIDGRRYILFNNKIHLVDDYLHSQLSTNATFFADTKLLPETFNIASIHFPDNSISQIDGQWRLKTPVTEHSETLNHMLLSWQEANAIFVDRYTEPSDIASITLISDANERLEFVIVSDQPHLILGRADMGIQYHLGSDDTQRLLPAKSDD